MKKVLFVLICFLIVSICAFSEKNISQAGAKDPASVTRLIVHTKGSLYLVNYRQGGRSDVNKLPFYFYWGVVENNQTLYALISDRESSKVARYDLVPEVSKNYELILEEKGFRCVFLKDKNFYMGSKNLWHINFNTSPPQLKNYQKIPPAEDVAAGTKPYLFKEKTIDAFALSGDTLFVADNVMRPIYLLQYNISNPARPVHISTRDFGGGPNEFVKSADADENHFLLFLSFSRMDGWGHNIDIYHAGTLKLVTRRGEYMPRQGEAESKVWVNAVLAGDHVYVSAEKRGLASFKIAAESPFRIEDGSAPCLWLKKDGLTLYSLTGKQVLVYKIGENGRLNRMAAIDLPEVCTEIW